MEKIVSLFITMTMMIAPSVTPSDTVPEPTPDPIIAASVPTAEPLTIPIEYDDTAEREAHYIRNFEIIDAVKTDDGYDITCRFETFLEGRGTVSVTFNCYDKDGNTVDTFGGGFVGTDYTWSVHELKASVSDKTAGIGLVLN